jgi:hypothetical protein
MKAAGRRRSLRRRINPATGRRRCESCSPIPAATGSSRAAVFVTDVDIAWLPSWVGTRQGRNFKLDEDKLDIVSAPVPLEFLDGAMAIGILSWVREDSASAREAAPA